MRIISKSLLGVLLYTVAPASALASPVQLHCTGEANSKLDGRSEKEKLEVDASFDPKRSMLQISGFWGCVADLGETGDPNPRHPCSAPIAVAVSEGEASATLEVTGINYGARTAVRLSRYSGDLSVASIAVAWPASNAKWSYFTVNASLLCVPQVKRF